MKNLVEEVKLVKGFDDGINIVKKYKNEIGIAVVAVLALKVSKLAKKVKALEENEEVHCNFFIFNEEEQEDA